MSSTTKSLWTRIGRFIAGLAALVLIGFGLFLWWFIHGWTAAWGGRADYTVAYVSVAIGLGIAGYLFVSAVNRNGRATLHLNPRPRQAQGDRHRIPQSSVAPCPTCERSIDVRRLVCVYCGERTGWS